MKEKLDLANWNRIEHFNFFKQFDQPYYGVTVNVDCTSSYEKAKGLGVPFFNYYLHKSLVAINAVENFRYRIEGGEVYVYDEVDASATILREDKTFGFSMVKFERDFERFNKDLCAEIARVKSTTGLFTTEVSPSVIHFSALPWLNFSSISQASHAAFADSCPKISVGRLHEENGRKMLPFNIYVHHALIDGYHIGIFYEKLQDLLR